MIKCMLITLITQEIDGFLSLSGSTAENCLASLAGSSGGDVGNVNPFSRSHRSQQVQQTTIPCLEPEASADILGRIYLCFPKGVACGSRIV